MPWECARNHSMCCPTSAPNKLARKPCIVGDPHRLANRGMNTVSADQHVTKYRLARVEDCRGTVRILFDPLHPSAEAEHTIRQRCSQRIHEISTVKLVENVAIMV